MFKVEVKVKGEEGWISNAMEFKTEDEAQTYGADLYSRWTAVQEYRVVPAAEEEANK